MRAELPLGDLPQRVDGQRGHHERHRVEVQRQVHRVGREVVRQALERPADQGQQAEHDPGDRGGAERGEQAVLVGLFQPVRGHQVRHRGVLGRRPEQRDAGRDELHHVDPGQRVSEVDRQVQRDSQVQRRAEHVADDHVDPAVQPVRDRAGQRPEDQGRQQRGQPHPAHGAVLGGGAGAGQGGRQRRERDQAQPIPQAGQRGRDPQPAERPDGQDAAAPLARRGSEVHWVRVSTPEGLAWPASSRNVRQVRPSAAAPRVRRSPARRLGSARPDPR